MSPEVAAAVEDDADYSFALEYLGPPVTRDLPRAVPINVDRIPVAAVVSPQPYSNTLPLPIVQPISATEIISKKPSKDLKLSSVVSPTSVIPFDMRNNEASEGSFSKELGLGTETSVSSSSINEKDAENCLNNDPFASSGELTRDLECCNRDGELTSRDISCEFTSGIESSGALDSSSVFSVDYLSSRVSSSKFGNANRETDWDARPSSVRRSSVMTYGDIETDDDENTTEEFTRSEPEFVQRVRKEPAVRIKKGACYRCLKGNRFTEKEVCMVCDAKYCNSCVLRAMGSMPEGRKCVTCIGYPIDESKRGYLGKCSRMLKRLLNDLEVRQIMKAERLCEVNQLPPEYICVNGRPLYPEELILLQSCSNPPKKLKPGNYWYDKVSGLWGKEGQKPSQIITPHLNVGAPIKPDASNGNTKVYINCREITKVELRMLKLAGVQCAGNPHFWVNDDGSYQEEGQKNTKGYIWGKAGTKLLCAVLSLPVPSKSSQPCGEQVTSMSSRSIPEYLEQREIQKLLLIGYNGSGTSTIFKQARILYKDAPFSEEDREHIKSVIQSHLYSYIGTILEARERFEEESCPSTTIAGHDEENPYSISPCLKSFCDWLLRIMASGTLEAIFPAASREYAPVVEELLRTSAFHATYKRRNELDALPSIASYFLEQAVEILKPDYRPSDLDILYAERVTSSNGLSCVDFSFPDSSYDNNIDSGNLRDSMLRYQLIRLQAKGFGENCKWLQMLENVRIVIFCVSLSDYDQFAPDANGNPQNKMLSSRKFFENIVTHPTFGQVDCLLLLNKFDLFEEKIEHVPLNLCSWFDDFQPLMSRNRSNRSHHPTLGQLGFHYIAVKFKRLYFGLTGQKLYVSVVKGLEPNSVDRALKYAREVLNWDDERANISFSENSFYSSDESLNSH